jgi:hypothetical protein
MIMSSASALGPLSKQAVWELEFLHRGPAELFDWRFLAARGPRSRARELADDVFD